MIRRREFITLLGGAMAWPVAARAQKPAKLPTIGLLGALSPAASTQWTTAFLNRLRELGWTEGRNVAVVHRWLEGRTERAGELAAELVRLDVDVIVTHATLPTMGAKQATSITPIVRICAYAGPGRRRPCGQFGATGRQRHGPVAVAD